MNALLASVVIPAWNAAAFLERSVMSALAQTASELEVLVVDDGSTDDTHAVAAALARRDPRVLLLQHPASEGPSAARNTALANAKGEWIVLLDADDWMDDDRIERLTDEASGRRLDGLGDNLRLVDEAEGALLGLALDPQLMRHSEPLSLIDLLENDWPGRNTAFRSLGVMKPILRRKFLEECKVRYDPTVRLGEDLLIYATAILCGGRLGLTDAAMYHYAVREDSISTRREPTVELVDVNTKIRSAARERGGVAPRVLEVIDAREVALRFQVLTWALKRGDFSKAFDQASRLGPFELTSAGVRAITRLRESRSR